MNEIKTGTPGGIGFVGLLQIALIVLKLCGVIKWSWLWVLCPTWLVVGFILIGIIAAVVIAAVEK